MSVCVEYISYHGHTEQNYLNDVFFLELSGGEDPYHLACFLIKNTNLVISHCPLVHLFKYVGWYLNLSFVGLHYVHKNNLIVEGLLVCGQVGCEGLMGPCQR